MPDSGEMPSSPATANVSGVNYPSSESVTVHVSGEKPSSLATIIVTESSVTAAPSADSCATLGSTVLDSFMVSGFKFHSTSTVAVTLYRETTHATVLGCYFSDPMESVDLDLLQDDAAHPPPSTSPASVSAMGFSNTSALVRSGCGVETSDPLRWTVQGRLWRSPSPVLH